MLSQYNGMYVRLLSDSIGSVTGTVVHVNDHKIDLKDVSINESQVISDCSISNKIVKDIQIISINENLFNGSTPEKTPGKSITKSTPRHERRELFKNIPNTENAYICPESPPLVCKSNLIPKSALKQASSSAEKNILQNSKISNQMNDYLSPNRSNRQNFSGYESDPVSYKGNNQLRNNHRARHNSNQKRNQEIAWESIAIEDFVDEEFDFESNNAQFDKEACYSLIDAQKDCKKKANLSSSKFISKFFKSQDQVKLSTVIQKPSTQIGSKESNCIKNEISNVPVEIRNNPTLTILQKLEADFMKYRLSRSSASDDTNDLSSAQNGISYFLSIHQRNRLFHYFSTGVDPRKEFPPMHFAGLDWRRLIEFIASNTVKKLIKTLPDSHLPSARIVIIPTGPNFGGALVVNLARHLADLGCSVFILTDPKLPVAPHLGEDVPESATSAPKKESRLAAIYREEIQFVRNIYMEETPNAPPRNLIHDNIWNKKIPGIEIITSNQMFGCKYDIDKIIWGHGFDIENTPIEFIKSAHRWISLHAISVDFNIDMVNSPPNFEDLNVMKMPSKRWIFDVGFPTIAPGLQFLNDVKLFVVRIPAGERQLQQIIKLYGFKPLGVQNNFNISDSVYEVSAKYKYQQ